MRKFKHWVDSYWFQGIFRNNDNTMFVFFCYELYLLAIDVEIVINIMKLYLDFF